MTTDNYIPYERPHQAFDLEYFIEVFKRDRECIVGALPSFNVLKANMTLEPAVITDPNIADFEIDTPRLSASHLAFRYRGVGLVLLVEDPEWITIECTDPIIQRAAARNLAWWLPDGGAFDRVEFPLLHQWLTNWKQVVDGKFPPAVSSTLPHCVTSSNPTGRSDLKPWAVYSIHNWNQILDLTEGPDRVIDGYTLTYAEMGVARTAANFERMHPKFGATAYARAVARTAASAVAHFSDITSCKERGVMSKNPMVLLPPITYHTRLLAETLILSGITVLVIDDTDPDPIPKYVDLPVVDYA